jgi:acetyl esterase/lipase
MRLIQAVVVAGIVAAEERSGIEYGKAGGESLRLDAHVPDGNGPFPVALVVHGGGWNSGDKQKDVAPITGPLTKESFVWFSINYRLAPANRWPACLEDVQTAIRWVKAHAAEYKGDPQRVALIGFSAGGHLACQAAVMAQADTRVQAVVGFAPPTDHEADSERRGELSPSMTNLLNRAAALTEETRAVLREISPINFVKRGLPPLLLIHGTEDKSVPYQQSVNFQKRLRELDVPCELITIDGAPHRITEWEKFDASFGDKMIAWLKQTLPAVSKIKIVLVGDSTVTDKSGWGLGFKEFLTDRAECINTAIGGRSSKSFVNEGHWSKALGLKGDYYLIQFGHNDEPGKGSDRETDPATTYREFMTRYVDEARAIGAKPILVTSLVRRQWDKSSSDKINSSLVPYVETVKQIAAEKKVPLVDLHASSKTLCEEWGKEKCYTFSPVKGTNGFDNTHLNATGSIIFARLVVEELVRVVPELKPCFRSEPLTLKTNVVNTPAGATTDAAAPNP